MMEQSPKRERRMSLAVETKNSVMKRLSSLLPKGTIPDLKKEKENLLAEVAADTKVFGVELKTAVMRSNKLHYLLPAVVYKCMIYLEQRGSAEEGIFRLTGSVADMKKMKDQFDQGSDCNVMQCANPHTVSGLLKLFLRELPTPLLPSELSDGEGDVLIGVQSMVNKLPQEARCLLSCLFRLLTKVSQQEAVTKMGITNLVIVFSPALQCSGTIVTTLIKHSATIFPDNLLDITTNLVVFGAKTDDAITIKSSNDKIISKHNDENNFSQSCPNFNLIPKHNNALTMSTNGVANNTNNVTNNANNNTNNTKASNGKEPLLWAPATKTTKKEADDEDIFIMDKDNSSNAIKTEKITINDVDIDALLLAAASKPKTEKGGGKSVSSKSSKNTTPTGSKNNTPILSRWRKKSIFDDDE